MLPFIWSSPTFCLAVLMCNTLTTDTKNSSDNIFAGVIQNITRVNKVLEELIHNYENLQKIYMSQEVMETKENYISQHNNKTEVQKRSDLDKFPATEMIWSDREDSANMDELSENEDNITIDVPTPTPTKSAELAFKGALTKPTQSEIVIQISSAEVEGKNISRKLPRPEVVFIDTHKKLKERQAEKKRLAKEKINNTTSKVIHYNNKKTRFSIQPSFRQKIRPSKGKNTTYENVKGNDVTAEWQEDVHENINRTIAKHMPIYINMTTANNIIEFQGTTTHMDSDYKENTSRLNKTIEFGKNKTKSKKGRRGGKENKISSTVPIKEFEGMARSISQHKKEKNDDPFNFSKENPLSKEMFMTNILRKAYGDACLKLVVRKCYKACQKTLEVVCRSKCKSGLKKVFKKEYKGQCDTRFADMDYRKTDKTDDTPNGYLQTVCQLERNNKPTVIQGVSSINNLTILRSKYEKACLRTSREKCNDACKYSYTKACKQNECGEKKTKNFEKNCKRQCKTSFTARFADNKKDSSSSSESSSSSDSSED